MPLGHPELTTEQKERVAVSVHAMSDAFDAALRTLKLGVESVGVTLAEPEPEPRPYVQHFRMYESFPHDGEWRLLTWGGATVALRPIGVNVFRVGVAMCAANDNFMRKTGRTKALGRSNSAQAMEFTAYECSQFDAVCMALSNYMMDPPEPLHPWFNGIWNRAGKQHLGRCALLPCSHATIPATEDIEDLIRTIGVNIARNGGLS
jgi:hypothetical protein